MRALLDHLEIERAALVGNSLGARIALELALAHPERVTALALVGPPPIGEPRSPELAGFDEREDALLEAGGIEEAVELNLRTWLAQPSPQVRRRVGTMQRRAFEVQLAAYEQEPKPGPVSWLADPPVWERLGDVAVPTLVVVGGRDVAEVRAAASRLAREMPDARREVVAGAGHLPGLERPEEFNRIVLDFLASA